MKALLKGINTQLGKLESGVLLLSLAAMLLAVLTAIIGRLFHIDVPWVTPAVLALMIVATFAGAALASAQRRHITMDLLGKALSLRARGALSVLTGSLAAAICVAMTAGGVRWVQTNIEFNEPISLALKIPDYYLEAVVPIGFALMAIHFVVNVLQDIGGLVTGDFSHLPETAGPHDAAIIPKASPDQT